MRVTQPFDASTLLSIDPELRRRVDFAQGREHAERQMGVFQQPLNEMVPLGALNGRAECGNDGHLLFT
jgi:hypothetical protein